MTLAFFVLIQYRSVTDRRADGQTDGRNIWPQWNEVYNTVVSITFVAYTSGSLASYLCVSSTVVFYICVVLESQYSVILPRSSTLTEPCSIWQYSKKEEEVSSVMLTEMEAIGVCSRKRRRCQVTQESCATAKMTAQCAIYMCALKIFGTPWLRPRLLFPTFSWAFVWIDPMNVATKFEVRIALSVPEIIGGTPKIWAVHGYAHAPFSPKS